MGLTKAPACLSPPSAPSPRKARATEQVAHQGLLKYQSTGGAWKERWFVLDASQNRLVKCKSSASERSTSRASSKLGRSTADVRIADVRGLSPAQSGEHRSAEAPEAGLDVVTRSGQRIRFLTGSQQEEEQWLEAYRRLSQGFTRGVAERLAERELLAGKYALVRELGRGASGIVYLYTYQGKPYAVKKFVPQKAKGIPNRLAVPGAGAAGARPGLGRATVGKTDGIPEDVRREIALLKKASHLPCVIQLHDVIANTEEQQFYLVMEYMGGGAIAEWDAERKCYARARNQKSLSLLDEKTVRAYMTNLLLGIQALHQNGLCHRDIKPENLMANEERTMCKIGDLGIAHYFHQEADGELVEETNPENIALWDIAEDTGGPRTRPEDPSVAIPSDPHESRTPTQPTSPPERRAMLKSTKGTYQFLPPEALSGDEFDGFKADIWSIGVTLYALLFGYLPFFSTDLVKLFEKIERDPVVVPASCHDDEVKDLLLRILEKDPEKRISIEEILAHSWMHRHVDSKALTQQVQALKRAPPLCVDALELGGAVSVLQSRFEQLSRAVRDDSLGELQLHTDETVTRSGGRAETAPYVPRPIETSAVQLPAWMRSDLNTLATQLHFDWCRAKHLDGWVHGATRDDGAKVHPLLVPLRDLPNSDRLKNIECAEETLKCVLALGCHVDKGRADGELQCVNGPGGLVPADHVSLAWDMLLLVDLLAENSHEVWAATYVQQGWRHGTAFDADAQTHPSLKPYMELEEEDKILCREGVGAVLKSCVCLGYTFSCAREKPKTRRPRSSKTVWSV